MQWSGSDGAGFTAPGVRPWLPFGDAAACNVADQRDDPGSVLHLCRDLIALRRSRPELQSGSYRTLPTPAGAWAWRRGETVTAAVNLSGEEVRIPDVIGRIAVATDRARDGEAVDRELWLGPWSGAIVTA